MPGWLDEAVRAVSARIATESGASSTATWRPIGEARADGHPGWFAVDVRGRRVNPDTLDALRLAAADAAPSGGLRVMEAVQEGEVLRVRVGAHIDTASLTLWSLQQTSAYLWVKLREGLEGMAPAGLPDALARGRLAPIPAPPSRAALPELNDGQRAAYAACASAGLHLVWGPPGTGKTAVLARAIADLLARGKRVLLVSNTNVAVDNAVQGVIELRPPAPGQLVRVGPPQLPGVAEDDRVALPRLVAARCRAVEDRRVSIERQLVERRGRRDEAQSLRVLLNGYDPDAYRTAVARSQGEERIAGLALQAQARQQGAVEARSARDRTGDDLRAARRAADQTAGARALLREGVELRQRLETLEMDVGRQRASALHAQERIRGLEQALGPNQDGLIARVRQRGARARLAEQRAEAERALAAATAQEESAARLLDRQRQLVEPRIAACLQRAAPVDWQELEGIDRRLHLAETAQAQAEEVVAEAEQQLEAARQSLLAAEAVPRATPDDRRLVAEADARHSPQQHERLASLLRSLAGDKDQAELERRHERLLEELDGLRRDAEGEIIRAAGLVATTLARFRIHPATLAGPYDVVLVDEVSTATVPEVLLALGAAREGAVLFGDFMQIGAIRPAKFERFDAVAQEWWSGDCFRRCGITTPQEAGDNPGCAVLTQQYRFGPHVTALANDILYGGVLQVAREQQRDDGDHELVLIDTDGLGDLAIIRRTGKYKGWWPAGSLLARVLAQHHCDRGETVGVLAPYRLQVEAAVEALRDIEPPDRNLMTEVGTVHQFQGRQFDVMVFDLMEDGGGSMRTARDGRSPFDRDSARMFGVGITRGRRRTYLVASGTAVRGAAPGTVLAALQRQLDDGRAGLVQATRFLVPVDAEPAPIASRLHTEMAEAFRNHVRVRAIHDEHAFYDALHGLIAGARRNIWMWAPWTANRTDSVLPLLAGAISRGVRVTIFVRTDRDSLQGRPALQQRLRNLREAGLHVIPYHHMHQKIVVVDEWITLVGSLNALSHRDTREIMLEHEGAFFARRLLQDEHAETFAAVPPCDRCGNDAVELSRSGSAKRDYAWYWRCGDPTCRWRRDVDVSRPASESRTRVGTR